MGIRRARGGGGGEVFPFTRGGGGGGHRVEVGGIVESIEEVPPQ